MLTQAGPSGPPGGTIHTSLGGLAAGSTRGWRLARPRTVLDLDDDPRAGPSSINPQWAKGRLFRAEIVCGWRLLLSGTLLPARSEGVSRVFGLEGSR